MTDRTDWDDDASPRRQPGGGSGVAATAHPAGPGYAPSGGGFEQSYGYGPMPGYGNPYAMRRPTRTFPIETKPFFLTSEFAAYLLATVALIITTAVDDSIDAWRFWILQTALTAFYLVSRGIAKSGTKSRSWDPREDPDLLRRGDGDRD